MQVFLPSADFALSARCLDNSRLIKQNLETVQILNTLLGWSKGWANHPAVTSWKGYEPALLQYLDCTIQETILRGFSTDYASAQYNKLKPLLEDMPVSMPIWWGDINYHRSHKYRLLQKGWEQKYKGQGIRANKVIEWYANLDWPEMNNVHLMCHEYLWPSSNNDDYVLITKTSKQQQSMTKGVIEVYGLNPYYNRQFFNVDKLVVQ